MASPLSSILQRIGPRALELLPSGRVLAAVSGGADSLALLRILLALELDVTVAHINHQMRAEESDEDEAHVRELCRSLGVRCEVRRVQVLEASNIEAQARALRYHALEEVALNCGCGFIATGHTASDNLETILLHWLRGATVTGMRGIQSSRAVRPGSQVLVARPLLEVTRGECEAICAEASWAWRQDSSNESPKYLRNRVRAELVPLLANLIDTSGSLLGASERMARQSTRAAELWADDLDLLDKLAQAHLDSICTRRSPGLVVLDGDAFRLLHPSLQRRVLRLGAQEAEGEVVAAGEVSSAKIEEVRAWIVAGQRRRVWQWKKSLRAEWCGAGSGNRIRLSRVELGAAR